MADACWFKRTPSPEGAPFDPEEWEKGTAYQWDQHGTHGYAICLSADDDGTPHVIPFKDVNFTSGKPQPKKDKDKDKPKTPGHVDPGRQGIGHR